MNEIKTLSNDINVITAEINAYQRVAGEAIFEIGRRLEKVRREKLAETRGGWTAWLREIEMSTSQADRFIKVFREYDGGKLPHVGNIGFRALYEIATMPADQRDQPHTIPSTGETKTVDEMTVRELREVKAELKRKQAELDAAKRSEQIAIKQNERLEEELATARKPETVVIEKEVERIVEIDKTDYKAAERLRAYEERFGALENYEDRFIATNLNDISTSVRMFIKSTRDMSKRFAYLAQYTGSVQLLPRDTQNDFKESIDALYELANLLQPRDTHRKEVFEAVIIEN